MAKHKRILIRVDASAPSRKALRAGLELAKAMRAEAIGVYTRRSFEHMVSAEFDAAAEIERIREAARKEGDKALAAFERTARKARVRFMTDRAKGDRAFEAVLEATRRLKCDLIVTAPDAETGSLLGKAQVPVLVVP
ncbi:MAG TPA: universal stress protein [Burkholderiales bacterium]|nr:universal stress protein [Burkholderiales bacterium]